MRKILLLLAFVSTLAHAQYYGGYLPKSGGTITGNLGVTGNVNVQGNLSSTLNTQPASITNSGVALTAAPNVADVMFFDSTKTANNRTAEWLFFQGALQARFKSDDGATALTALAITGGQVGGITGITSSSGTGAWAHTGAFSATGNISTPANIIARGPTVSTPVNVATESSVQLFTPAANQSAVAYINPTNTTDNRIAYSAWGGTAFTVAGFANDVWNNGKQGITMTGGYATGVTAITETAGTSVLTVAPTGTTVTGNLSASGGLQLPVTTVAALPACSAGLKGTLRAVSDAAATPAYHATVAAGGTVSIPVYCDGTNWTND